MIPVAIQFDGPSSTSDQVLERRIVETYSAYNYCVTLAVIPFRRMNGHLVGSTKEHAGHLLDVISRGTVDIVSHGFFHGQHPVGPHGQPSDFTGLASTVLREVMRRGLLCLTQVFGDKIYGFVPRRNSFAKGTPDDRLREQSDLTISPLAEVAGLVTAGKWRRGLRHRQLRQRLHWRLQPNVPQHIVTTGPLWQLVDPWGRETYSFGTVV